MQTKCEENDLTILSETYLFKVPPKCSISTLEFTYKNEKGVIVGLLITLEDIEDILLPVKQV